MHAGHVISGAGHLALIGWVFFGDVFSDVPDPVEFTEVAVISGAEFAAMMEARQVPEVIEEVAQPAAPEAVPEAPEVDVAPEPPETPPAPAEPVTPAAETPPEVSEAAPEAPEPPAEIAPEAPEVAESPVEEQVERIAPEAAPAPDTEAEEITPQEAVVPDEAPEQTPEEPQEAAEPPQAADRIATEADEAPKAAVTRSLRPPARRPEAPSRTAQTDAPAQSAETDAQSDTDAAVQAALEAAQSSAQNDVPTGPPLSSGEKDALRLAVQGCWVVDPGASWARVTVTVGMSMQESGKLVPGSLSLISSEGGDASAVEAAFQAARRAILRCQKGGYDLPVEKFGQWKEIEMTFNPERMRIR